jgi:hypothetical protein
LTKRLLVAVVLALVAVAGTGRRAACDPVAGPFKFDLKFGPAIGIIDFHGSQFHLGMHFGIDVTPQLPQAHIYIDLPLAFNFGNDVTDIMLIPGVEADILLPVGQPIYIYPMFGLGVGIFSPSRGDTQSAFAIRLGAGVKYVLDGRWNFFFEPLNLEFYPVGIENATLGFYNLLFGAGVNF